MYKKATLIFYNLVVILFCASAHNSEYVITVKSKNLKYGKLIYDDSILIKQIKKTNKIQLNIDEPKRLYIQNSKTRNYLFFFIEQGKHTITIDLDNKTISSKTSKLSQENAETIKIKNHYDSLNEVYLQKITNNQDSADYYNDVLISINKQYHKTYYNWCLKHPSSFISLSFLNFTTHSYLTIGITKEEINALFNLLDNRLYNYPTYKECEKYIATYINNPDYKIEEPPTPLWNPRTK